jgi:xylulokinase
MPNLILAHDLGTTGNKATLYDPGGELVASAFAAYETRYFGQNCVEQDPADWWHAVAESTRRLLVQSKAAPADIACVTFSGQMMGCVAVDARGEVLRPAIIWADQRATAEAALIAERVGAERVYEVTGHRVGPSYSAAKILWIRAGEPDVFRRAARFHQAKDYVILRLTGAHVTDYSDASGTNLFDLETRDWSPAILGALDLDRGLLPEVRRSTDVAGELLAGPAEECSLRAGTPVVVGGGDGACAAVGAGVVREGAAYNYVGSSSWIALASSSPLPDPEQRTSTFCHLDPDLYMPTGTMQAAGASYQWFRDALCQEEVREAEASGRSPYELIDALAAQAPPGADRLLFLPYLLGERSPHWNPDARGAFIGLSPNHRKAHMARAVLEGVALNLRIILDAFRRQGAEVKMMRLIGGGAKGALWRQIMADVYGIPVTVPEHTEEATSLGAAVAGGIGVGLFRDFAVAEEVARPTQAQQPDPEAQKAYDALYPLFSRAYEGLVETFAALR